jgi:hypothetical protein
MYNIFSLCGFTLIYTFKAVKTEIEPRVQSAKIKQNSYFCQFNYNANKSLTEIVFSTVIIISLLFVRTFKMHDIHVYAHSPESHRST